MKIDGFARVAAVIVGLIALAPLLLRWSLRKRIRVVLASLLAASASWLDLVWMRARHEGGQVPTPEYLIEAFVLTGVAYLWAWAWNVPIGRAKPTDQQGAH